MSPFRRRRGLSTPSSDLIRLRWFILIAGGLVAAVTLSIALRSAQRDPILLHGSILTLMALTIAAWAALPLSSATCISLGSVAIAVISWLNSHLPLLGWDAFALLVLCVLAAHEESHRRGRLHQLQHTLGDLKGQRHVKDEARRALVQTDEALRHKLRRYQELKNVAEQLSRLVTTEKIGHLLVDRAFELIGKSHACLLLLLDHPHQTLALSASRKAPGVDAIRSKQGDQFDRYVLRTQRPLVVNDARRDFRFNASEEETDRPIASVIACPLMIGGAIEGVLRLDGPEADLYSQDDLRFLDILLDLVDTALVNARLFTQTQQLAMTDGLTGAYRRQPFLDHLTREVARAGRSAQPVSVLVIDIDDFKRYNDTYGHSAGDLVLKTIAEIARGAMPPHGLYARYGGEEFAMTLPQMPHEQAYELANRIRQLVQERVRVAESGASVTISIGVASVPADAQTGLELIRRADERLYDAKRAGKNRVIGAEGTPS